MATRRGGKREIALKRIEYLFESAKKVVSTDPILAQRYINHARKIVMRQRIRLPQQYRRLICKYCKRFIFPGVNCRVRIQRRREPHIVITCLSCGGKNRIPLRKQRLSSHQNKNYE